VPQTGHLAPSRGHNGLVRVMVTRIWTDGTIQRRMVGTANQRDPWK
jgi:hypothetical protein